MSDASIMCQRKDGNRKVAAGREYSVGLVSPICVYDDIEKVQEIVRALRSAGAFANGSVGIHIHINAAPFEAKQLRNLVNIVAAKEDMIYRALLDYELLLRGSKTGSYATVEPCEGKNVPVLLWSVSKNDELALDRYEGYPTFYEKENMPIELDGKTVDAFVNVMTEGHQLGMPSQRYVDTIAEGYQSQALTSLF